MKAIDWSVLTEDQPENEIRAESMEDNRFDVDDPRESAGDRLDAQQRKELSTSDYGLPDLRKFPMPDAAHVRAAEAYFRFAPDDRKAELARNILTKARQFGVEVHSTTVLNWAAK